MVGLTIIELRTEMEFAQMWRHPENEKFGDDIFLAGERVPPGHYRQIGVDREIVLEREGVLPGSLDGRVACYVLLKYRFAKRETQAA